MSKGSFFKKLGKRKEPEAAKPEDAKKEEPASKEAKVVPVKAKAVPVAGKKVPIAKSANKAPEVSTK
ncbi:MAG: hypothetical protein OSB41_00575, partial [Kiritimatiellae bacterium]|nr:hypothetical protein [Kiritimatiellia bacterium]